MGVQDTLPYVISPIWRRHWLHGQTTDTFILREREHDVSPTPHQALGQAWNQRPAFEYMKRFRNVASRLLTRRLPVLICLDHATPTSRDGRKRQPLRQTDSHRSWEASEPAPGKRKYQLQPGSLCRRGQPLLLTSFLARHVQGHQDRLNHQPAGLRMDIFGMDAPSANNASSTSMPPKTATNASEVTITWAELYVADGHFFPRVCQPPHRPLAPRLGFAGRLRRASCAQSARDSIFGGQARRCLHGRPRQS